MEGGAEIQTPDRLVAINEVYARLLHRGMPFGCRDRYLSVATKRVGDLVLLHLGRKCGGIASAMCNAKAK